MIRALLLLLAFAVLACDNEGPLQPARNQCFDDTPCGRRLRCDPVLLRCVREKTDEPYPLYVRVTAPPSSDMLADAGIELVPEVVRYLGELAGRRDAQVLMVPTAVTVAGEVVELDGGSVAGLLHSQVTIVATNSVVPTAARVVETRAASVNGDGGAPTNLSVQLDRDQYYDVRVQPLSTASARLPPYTRTEVGSDQLLRLHAPTVEGRPGRFIYREATQRAAFARLEEKTTGRIVSSTASVETVFGSDPAGEERREGAFKLYADPEIFTGRNFDLVVSLGGFSPWQVTIRIDGERFLSGGDLALPPAPAPLTLKNVVEDQEGQPLAEAEIVFVSDYLPPRAPPTPPAESDAETPDTPTAFGADWCRWQDPARISCRGRFHTMSGTNGEYAIELIPGLYDVFVIPRGDVKRRDLIVTRHENPEDPGKPFLIGQAAGAPPLPLLLQAGSGTPYTGTINALNAPAPRVTLRARRLDTPSLSSWGLLADFNRTLSAVSDRKGHFSITPDVGYYDFVFEPELGSGLPWKLWLDCPNGPGAGGPLAAVELTAPVMVLGSVEVKDSGVKLPGAKIDAFTVVQTKNRGPRSVMIGRAVSDEKGDYMLALPNLVGEGGRCEGTASMVTDNERSRR